MQKLNYEVMLEPYSLASGNVGEPVPAPIFISRHRSKRAAGRVLGSLISGKGAASVVRVAKTMYPGCGWRYLARDVTTGATFSRNACKEG